MSRIGITLMRAVLYLTPLFSTSLSFGQEDEMVQFRKDFKVVVQSRRFSDTQLNTMFKEHVNLLAAYSDVSRFAATLTGKQMDEYPLWNFKNEKLYTDNIDRLLSSRNSNRRILACMIISSSGDITQEDKLLEKLKREKSRTNRAWAGIALLCLKSSHTTPLFDFLVDIEDLKDPHLFPLYRKLNKDSLRETAYRRIHRKDAMSRIMAVQILAATTLNEKSEELLKQAVTTWDTNLKGYAIFSMGALQMGHLLTTLQPLVSEPLTRQVALQALANSPTKEDNNYLKGLIAEQDTVSHELMNSLFRSKNLDNVKYWLKLLYTKPIARRYVFFILQSPELIQSDGLLPELHTALEKIEDPQTLGELVRALKNRTDDVSVGIMVSMLSHKDKYVRYWAASTLKDNPSPKIGESTKNLIAQVIKED